MKNNQNEKTKVRKNSALKNAFIAYGAVFKRYPASPVILILYIICRVIIPITYTIIPATAIRGITSGDLQNFLISVGLVLLAVLFLNMLAGITNAYLQGYRLFTRSGVHMINFFKKSITTGYMNIEPEPKHKIMDKASDAISSNYHGIEHLMQQSMEFVILIFGMFSYGTAVFMLDWKIMAVTIGMFIADTLCREWAIRYSDKHREERSVLFRKINYMKNSIKNVSAGKDIRIFALEGWFHSKFEKLLKDVEKNQRGISLHWYSPTVADCLFMLPRDFLAYSLLIAKVLSGEIDPATFTLYLGLVSGFANWIYGLSNNLHNIRATSHEFNDYNDFMALDDMNGSVPEDTDCPIKSDNDSVKSDQASVIPALDAGISLPPEVEFKNVAFNYEGSDKKIFEKLSFKIRAGEKVALVGNNGAGKTTIVKLLCGLYPPTEGEIFVNGKLLWNGSMSIQKYMDTISVLFQDTNPFAFSVAENVASCDAKDIDRERVRDCLKKAGLLEKVDTLIHKEDTCITQQLDDDGVQLSGGEIQKLLLAKAIYKDGQFLILDEPTSALDPIAESKIYEEYNNLASDKTAVFISHRLASTKFCDRILFLDNGQIVEEGSHEELMSKGGKYREIFDIQSHYYQENSNEE
ncbi:MAG: ABC transporter ATP-binding protein [Treponema sp.]|nr:ABC transporter ATP-binding protein [Treponema sp.]